MAETLMPRLIIMTRGGEQRETVASTGTSVMQAIRDSGTDELAAVCGGCCSCGTCHVHVDPGWLHRLPPPGADERDMLEMSEHHRPESRLACQLRFTDDLDGLRVTIAPEDWV